MKKRYTSQFPSFKQCLCLLLLPLALNSCLYEDPEMTSDGQLGIDPTEVNVTADIKLNIKLSESESTRSRVAAEGGYQHRFIVETYLDDMAVHRQVVYEDVDPDRNRLSVPVTIKLHARDYRAVVWADYVKTDSEDDLFYNTEILDPLIATEPYEGNSDYKDAFYATQELSLSDYRDEWGAKVPVEIELKRPVARYELVATDVASFLKKIADKEISGKRFTARIKYRYYLSVGFDVLDDKLRHALMYLQYSKTFDVPAEGVKDFVVGLDYVFVGNEPLEIPIEVEIVDEKKVTVARTMINVPCQQGKKTVVRDNFLTADPDIADDGVGIDPGFDDEVDMEVGVI